MENNTILNTMVQRAMTEKVFLNKVDMSASEMKKLLKSVNIHDICNEIIVSAQNDGRFSSQKVLEAAEPLLSTCSSPPQEGRLLNAYNAILLSLFPEKQVVFTESQEIRKGRLFLLQLLSSLYRFERKNLPFDPTSEICLLSYDEIPSGDYENEYVKLLELINHNYLYEFMRIGVDITPFNTLGHIAGVHYVAMHAARQLTALGVPVDLALISGAAAGHDIGKYGCKKSEEKRIPYLHYYYTDLCFKRFDMPMIGHIAANHSTWDLELDNLSAEALLLIYADFRVKSTRNSDGRETVNFYTLDQSFEVILNKLDNVDAAKEHRYRKVYNKLKDFENYMIDLGVDVKLPGIPARKPETPLPSHKKDFSLLSGDKVVSELKYLSIEHNINLMHKFYSQEEFAGLLETARSEKQWKNLRTYISIFGEYSTYMTEKQKLMTLRFLCELLVHRESDIRNQAGEIIGQIIAHFNEEYKKELPDGVLPPKKEITNLSLWENMLNFILMPDHRLTQQHKKWIENTLKSVISALLANSDALKRKSYIDALLIWYENKNLTAQNKEALLQAAIMIDPSLCTDAQIERFTAFAVKTVASEKKELKTAAVDVLTHFNGKDYDRYRRQLKTCLGLDPDMDISQETLSEMYLDNLKASTPWPIKVANIQLMLRSLEEKSGEGQALHVATHLGNLIKVSETVIVRKSAGSALVSIIDRLPLEQRNEIAVELGKGLEIGDYQFSKYIPDYLGLIMLNLPPRELDELILDLEKFLVATNGQVAAAVLHTFGIIIENYGMYQSLFGDQENESERNARKYKLVSLIIRGFANYNSTISQEALWTIGMHLFGSPKLSLTEKYNIFCHCGKRLLTLYENRPETELDFFNNAAALKHLYRFICSYELEVGDFKIPESKKVAFFPGTFDPFSLSHKAIATEIRNMGFEVFLALDEFSWSKKTQPRLQRRKILSMSVSDEENIYIFPDDIPVNIANPSDLSRLKELFKGKELSFVAGSDVIENASCYRAEPSENSIHSLNHIIFKRSSDEKRDAAAGKTHYPITGEVINLHLEEYFEDISSTRIRENIDSGRDISNLIDPVAQNYIFENGLYMREPAYKHVLQARDIHLKSLEKCDSSVIGDMKKELTAQGYDIDTVSSYLDSEKVRVITIRDGNLDNKIVAVAAVSKLDSIDFLSAFHDQDIAAYIRSRAAGSIAVIGGLFFSRESRLTNLEQVILVEMLSELLAKDYTYVVYNPCDQSGLSSSIVSTVTKQGFVNIAPKGSLPIFAVDMSSPVIIFKNVDTLIKHPLNKNEAVLEAVEKAHDKMLEMLTSIYPGELILSYNSGILYYKIIHRIAQINNVSPVPYDQKAYGKYMAVPFGKLLEGAAVPNTVTKSMHTEKYFCRDVSDFTIEEKSYYSTLENQVKTIKSFNRPVILVDDLLHKGYRMNEIDPILKANDVQVVETVVGVQTGRGRDLMTIKERTVDSAYFLPNLKCWIDESDMYPYIGGDSMKDKGVSVGSQTVIPSLNLILPFAVPTFLGNIPGKDLYNYSMTCLENAHEILKTIESEYQKLFEKKLTLKRLGEVINDPKNPDMVNHLTPDTNTAPSEYIENDIEKLIRMRKMFK
ncbi:MAG: hypothetical protein UC708_05320 [Anaerovoracaceae bacterium]|nr:hypothetical protein [Anaerovoracaceae bacterium]